MNSKKELLWNLWVNPRASTQTSQVLTRKPEQLPVPSFVGFFRRYSAILYPKALFQYVPIAKAPVLYPAQGTQVMHVETCIIRTWAVFVLRLM